MTAAELADLTVHAAADLLRRRELSSVDLTRAGGTKTTIHDQPFDFNYQRTYVYENVVLQPGDKLTTTCTYGQPARFGKGTNDEMCYFFAIHWPGGALARNNLFSLLHGPDTCMD